MAQGFKYQVGVSHVEQLYVGLKNNAGKSEQERLLGKDFCSLTDLIEGES